VQNTLLNYICISNPDKRKTKERKTIQMQMHKIKGCGGREQQLKHDYDVMVLLMTMIMLTNKSTGSSFSASIHCTIPLHYSSNC